MRLHFVYTNIDGFHYEAYHFGLASIVAVARKAGHEVKVSLVCAKSEVGPALEKIRESGPRVVGFTAVSSQFANVRELARGVKERLPGALVVCGGVHCTLNPRSLLEAPEIDAFFIGESELSFVEFLEKVQAGKPYLATDNLAYAQGGALVANPKKPLIQDLDALPFPDREVYPYQSTIEKVGYAPFFFSRGCPFTCTYCANQALGAAYGFSANPVRDRSPQSCIREIEWVLERYRAKTISIEDDVFGLKRSWRNEFLRLYNERIRPRGVRFMCLLRVELATEEFVRRLKEAGCTQVFFGVESGDEEIRLKTMGRRMSNEKIIAAFDLCRKHGVRTLAVNIIGVPGESREQVWNTIKLNRRLKPAVSGVNIFYPYRGTKLGDHCFEQGLVDLEKLGRFSNERRDTVLRFPPEHREFLLRTYADWQLLVNPASPRLWAISVLRKIGLLEAARAAKRALKSRLGGAS